MGASTDPIADMLTSVRNALRARHPKVDIPASRIKGEIARVLKEEGFLAAYKVIEENKRKVLRLDFDHGRTVLRLSLKYGPNKQSVISGLRRMSNPGWPIFRVLMEFKPVVGGLGINV